MWTWRRWVIALAVSLAGHVGVGGGIRAGLILRDFLSRPDVEIEVTEKHPIDLHDLPLGPPPTASPHEDRAPSRGARRPKRSLPAPRAQDGPETPAVAKADEPSAGALPDAAAPVASVTGVDLLRYGPEGTRVIVLVRLDRVRGTDFGPVLDAMLGMFGDRRGLLQGTGLDLGRDFDALLIATPDPRDATLTFLAARHRLGDGDLRAALDRGAAATGRALLWRTVGDRPWGEWRASAHDPFTAGFALEQPSRVTPDQRLVVLPIPGTVLVTPPVYQSLLLSSLTPQTADGGSGAGDAAAVGDTSDGDADASAQPKIEQGWTTLVQRLDAEDRLMPPGAVAQLTVVDAFGADGSARGPDGGRRPAPGVARELLGLPAPRVLTASIGIQPVPFLDLTAYLGSEDEARVWERGWPSIAKRLAADSRFLAPGLGDLFARAEVERTDAQIHLHESASEAESVRAVQLAVRLLATSRAAR